MFGLIEESISLFRNISFSSYKQDFLAASIRKDYLKKKKKNKKHHRLPARLQIRSGGFRSVHEHDNLVRW